MKQIVKASTGFIYYISLTGVTGTRTSYDKENNANIRLVKQFTQKPICVGFGVSTSSQVKTISKVADGVIVGSAIVNQINKNKGKASLVKNVSRYVWTLAKGLS